MDGNFIPFSLIDYELLELDDEQKELVLLLYRQYVLSGRMTKKQFLDIWSMTYPVDDLLDLLGDENES